MNSTLICFAGLDGSGKTMQASLLWRWLTDMQYPCELIEYHTKPTKNEYNRMLRKSINYLTDNKLTISPLEIELIKEAFATQIKLNDRILPALRKGINIILDRPRYV